MISTEEKIEIMPRERKAYKEGYMDALRLVVLVVVPSIIIWFIWWE